MATGALLSRIYAACRRAGLIDRVLVVPLSGAPYALDAEVGVPDQMHYGELAMTGDHAIRFSVGDAPDLARGAQIRVGGVLDETVNPPSMVGGETWQLSESPKRLSDGSEAIAAIRRMA